MSRAVLSLRLVRNTMDYINLIQKNQQKCGRNTNKLDRCALSIHTQAHPHARLTLWMSEAIPPQPEAGMTAPVAVAVVPVPAPQQSLFLYRFRIFAGVHAVMEIPCLALALWIYSIIPWIGAILAVVGSGIAIIVSVNIAGQFCCYPRGNYRQTGSWLNVILMLISCFLSVWFIWLITWVATWCATNADDHNNEIQEACGIAGAMAAFSIITAFFRLVTTAIMIPYCCCGWTGTQKPAEVQVVHVV